MNRCGWCETDDLYIRYHDTEWGVPVYDDKKQFEFLVLESAQAGLSWLTILKKRQNYKKAYSGFNVNKVAKYRRKEIIRLMNNPGIVRNLKKIEASVNNANCFIDIKKEFGSFSNYLWKYVGYKQITNRWKSITNLPANTVLSDAIAKDLKKRGFKFLGSTTIYAHLQATGVVNDHIVDCFRYSEIKKQIMTGQSRTYMEI